MANHLAYTFVYVYSSRKFNMLLKKLKKQKMAIGILGQKIVIYGDNGTGKTTVAIEIGKQLCKQITSNPEAAPLVIGFENGTNASDDFYYVDGTD